MQGKTHATVGTAVTLMVIPPKDYRELVVVLAFGLIGAMISDIDAGSSKQHRQADAIIAAVTLLIFGAIMADHFWNLGICSRIVNDSGWLRILGGVFLFTLVCAYGKEHPHRSFAHSFLGLLLFDAALYMVIPYGVKPFSIAFLTHQLLDILNKKGVRLFYPVKKGYAFGIAKSDGMWNYLLFSFGTVAAVLQIVLFILNKS